MKNEHVNIEQEIGYITNSIFLYSLYMEYKYKIYDYSLNKTVNLSASEWVASDWAYTCLIQSKLFL